ncbi:MAG: SRPBCC family protein [Acidimicrobiales bacterium]|nr:SRPBCC family protein [Acidimicrobiales bacterium]
MAKAADISGTDQLKQELRNLAGAFGERAVASIGDKVGGTADRLTEYADNGGGPGLMAALTGGRKLAEGESPAKAALGAGVGGLKEKVKGAFSKGGGGGGGKAKVKVTNIVESIDIGVPRSVVYNQWTQFKDFSTFMKKVESVEQEGDEKLNWQAQIFWSHRNWKATITDQVPDKRIVWRSEGEKGRVDGTVTFHELAPELTRVLLDLEYHPQGFFERTGNLWRAQGRRARLELKHFRRQVMSQTILNPDEVEGWRGEIHDGEVTRQPDEESSEDDELSEDGAEDEDDAYDEDEDSEADDREEDHVDDSEEDDGDEEAEEAEVSRPRRSSGRTEQRDRERRPSRDRRQQSTRSREQGRRQPARRR